MHQHFSGKKSFKQSLSLQHSSIVGTPAKRSSVVQHERDRNDGDVQSESVQKQCLKVVAHRVRNFRTLQNKWALL